MIYNIEDVKKEVRIIMDKYPESIPLLNTGDVDSISIDVIIEQKIADAARMVENSAPSHLLDSGLPFGKEFELTRKSHGLSDGYVLLPDDFMRLVTFRMSDWERPVTVAITPEHPLYAKQSSRFAGIRGNPEKPVVALVQRPIGLVLEFYSCREQENLYVKHARYIPEPLIRDGQIHICKKLYRCVLYYTAFLVSQTLGEQALSERLLEISKELMK